MGRRAFSPKHVLVVDAFRAGWTGSDSELARQIGAQPQQVSLWRAQYRNDPTVIDQETSLRDQRSALVERAVEIVNSYDTPVTLRQLFYQLVAAGLIPNTRAAYQRLSKVTAAGRRDGSFPDLIDDSIIHRNEHFDGVSDALNSILNWYRRDRTEGQPVAIYIAVEKAGLVEQLRAWFSDLGIPIIALGGYASQSYVKMVQDDVDADGREAILLYAGDYDPSGEDIDRDFIARSDCWSRVERVALTTEQVIAHNLPPMPGKQTDPRAAGFIATHGELVQVELDALSPTDLRALFQAAIDVEWDSDAYDAVMAEEHEDREKLEAVIESEAE
jgi:transposase-like protein